MAKKTKKFITVPDSVILLRNQAHELVANEYITAHAYLNHNTLAEDEYLLDEYRVEVAVYTFSHFETLQRQAGFAVITLNEKEKI